MPDSPSQLKHYTLQAVAGAGKTTRLIRQVMEFMEQSRKTGTTPPRIMITTFTRRATGEVKERLMRQALKEKNWEWVNFISDSSHIFVSTLHGILYHFLKKYHPHWSSFSHLIDGRKILSSGRSVLRDIFEMDSSYIPLLEHYRYQDLVKLMLQHGKDLTIFKPLSIKEMNEQWIRTLQTVTQKKFKVNFSNLENIQEQCFSQKKDLSDKGDSLLLDKLFTACHPKNFENLETHYLLLQRLAQNFHIQWEKMKEKNGFIQIEDLENKTLQIIQTQKHKISAFSGKWQAWFIDEYQDLNPIQEKILNSFTKHAQRVWVVGDPQQSIYLFRRADPNVFSRRVETTKHAGTLEVKNKNFRSHSNLIEFFNDFFKKEGFQKMTHNLSQKSSEQNSIQFFIHKNKQDGNFALAQTLRQLLKNNSPGDICILLKTNQDVMDMGHFLKKLNLPVQIHSPNPLKREIIDALFFLKFLINPFDNENLIGLLRTPYFYIPDWEISLYSKKNQSLWISLNQKIKTHPTLRALNTLMKVSEQAGISSAFSCLLEDYLFIDLCYYQDPTGEQETNLWNLLTEMQVKEQNIHFKHYQFIEDKLNQFAGYGISEAGISFQLFNFIQLMTIHQSKGLEFEHVIIPNVDDSLVPPDSDRLIVHSKRWGVSIYNENKEAVHSVQQKLWKDSKKEASLQEQDRLLYVAMTRAKKTLTLSLQKKKLMKPTNSNTWIGRFNYFSKIKEQIEKNPDKNKITIKEKSYCIEISY